MTSDDRKHGACPQEWAGKEFYRDIGVAPDAGTDEIKRAARKILRECMPDRDTDSTDALAERYRSVSDALHVLRNPELRQRYDTLVIGGKLPQQAAES